MLPKSEMYEIVPVDPFSKIEKKSEELEKEIAEIKEALRGTVGLSKIESNASEFISNMLNMMQSTQKMLEEVAHSNQHFSEKLQASLDAMSSASAELSSKLSKVLDFFEKASEALGEEEEVGQSQNLAPLISDFKISLDTLIEQNKKTREVLESIERYLKKESLKTRVAPMQSALLSPPLISQIRPISRMQKLAQPQKRQIPPPPRKILNEDLPPPPPP